MKIRYDLTLDDMVAFNRYHLAHSPALRNARAVQFVLIWLVPALLVSVLLFALISSLIEAAAPEPRAVIGLVFAAMVLGIAGVILWARRLRRIQAQGSDRQVRRMYREGTNKALFTTHELELTANNLIERTDLGENTVKFEAIERVIDTGDFAIIYLSALSAYVIPRHAIQQGNYEEFVKAIAQRVSSEDHVYRED